MGSPAPDFKLQDFRGKEHALSDYQDRKLVVLAFLGTECPIVRLYAPRLVEFVRASWEQRFGLVTVADLQNVWLRAWIDQSDLGKVRLGQADPLHHLAEDEDVVIEMNGNVQECVGVGFILAHNPKARAWKTREEPDFYTVKRVLSPRAIRDVALPNRVVRTAHVINFGEAGRIADHFIAYHRARAEGGVGLTIREGASAHASSFFHPNTPRLNHPNVEADYRRLMPTGAVFGDAAQARPLAIMGDAPLAVEFHDGDDGALCHATLVPFSVTSPSSASGRRSRRPR